MSSFSWDVLEHLEYPQELLIQILQLQGVSVKNQFHHNGTCLSAAIF
jgi:hypothetical protein